MNFSSKSDPKSKLSFKKDEVDAGLHENNNAEADKRNELATIEKILKIMKDLAGWSS